MGAGPSCSITLIPTSKTFYWPGETVSGNVVITVKHPIKVKSMDVRVIGELISTVTVHPSSAFYAGSAEWAQTARQQFYYKDALLVAPPTENGYYLEPNIYHFPFSVRLAEYLPPSLFYSSERMPHIRYFVEVDVGRSHLHRSICEKVFILVTPLVPRPPNIRFIDRLAGNVSDLYIHGRLLRNYLFIGEPYITVELNIKNPSQTTIKETTVKLVQHRRLGHHHGIAVIFEESLSSITDFHNDHLHDTFEVPVPTSRALLAPSSVYNRPNTQDLPWVVYYMFEVKFKRKLFLRNLTLDFPLVVVNSNG